MLSNNLSLTSLNVSSQEHACFITQSCLTFCHPRDCNPLDSSDHGILQARILEWVANSFSRGSSQPNPAIEPISPAFQVDSLSSEPPGNPLNVTCYPLTSSVASESFPWILQGSSEKEGKMMTSKSTGGGREMWKPNRFIWAKWPALCLPRTDSLFSLCFPWAHLDSSEWAFRDPLCD